MNAQVRTAADGEQRHEEELIAELVGRARAAQQIYEGYSQEAVNEVVTAVAWALMEPERNRQLSELAVSDTGLGNVPDKITKNHRKTLGLLRDLSRAKSVGVIAEHPDTGIIEIARPVGVVGAIVPSTNPVATPMNKTLNALKGRNAIILAPSPKGQSTCARLLEYIHVEIDRVGAPRDLVQQVPAPVSKTRTALLSQKVDLVVVTGSQNNVRAASRSGTPAIGVGAGNVPVIVDDSADLTDAATKIMRSKTFDNATSCSSENSLVILDEVYDQAIEALREAGGFMADAARKQQIQDTLWVDGKLNRKVIAKDADVFAREAGLPDTARKARFFMVEETGVGPGFPFSDEKLALVLTVYRVRDLEAAIEKVAEILEFKGKGHSVGIHTETPAHARELAERLDVVRVLVNMAHTFGNGGGFDSGLNFTLSMGCGTWQGNSISENLSYKHFINITHLCRVIPEDRPGESELFGAYWEKFGR